MSTTSEQIDSIVLKVLKEVETPDVSSLSFAEKLKLAKNPNTSQETLKVLATDEDWGVRSWVAENPNTPQELLQVLATDEDWRVRYGVAENPNTPQEVLQVLATDEDCDVRYLVAQNPNYKKQTLERLTANEAKSAIYDLADDFSWETIAKEMVARMSGDEARDFLSDFKRLYDN